ncbi:hypothetical protein F4678DRAFT_484747 [Xylaria arbuscula]|nr:hypothetical protein F4678DRAFT_484747 [Xylaria arbuscula]
MRHLLASEVELIDANSEGSRDFTPLEEEISRYTEVIKILIDSGASVDSTSGSNSVLTYAASLKDIDILFYIVEHVDDKKKFVNTPATPLDKYTALYAAVEVRQVNTVRYLIEAGADPLLHHGGSGITQLAIHRAIEMEPGSDMLEIIQYLLDIDGSQLEENTSEGNTCLHLAADSDNDQCVDLFLSKNANCKAKNKRGQTPWQVACDRVNTRRGLPSLSAIGMFLKREVTEKDGDVKCPGKTWFVSDNGWFRFNKNSLDWGGGNLIYAALELMKPYLLTMSAGDYRTFLEKIDSGFAQHSEPYSALCIPYMSSTTTDFLENRWAGSIKSDKDTKYCVPYDPKTFGADIVVTIDEHCNPASSPEVLKRRNEDQVLTRYGKGLRPKNPTDDTAPDHPLRLITVPQLWCWRVGFFLILSGEAWAHSHLHLPRVFREHDPDKYIGRMLSYVVDYLDRPNMLGLSEPIFNIFSKSISAVAETVNEYTRLKIFIHISIEKERQFLHEINDIREEIAMMQTVLFQQEEIWKEFTYKTWPQFWPDGQNGRFKPDQFPKYRRRFEKLDQDAERVEKYILVQLDLKQKHAALKETHTTTVMSESIVGFTVIIIIFAPLSFLTSLFALPIDQFSQNQNDGKYTINYVGKWIATGEIASLAVTAAAILLACWYFLSLPIPKLIWSSKLKGDHAMFNKENRSESEAELPIERASMLSVNPENGQETTSQGTSPKTSNYFGNVAKKMRLWKSRNQESHSRDLENGQQTAPTPDP